MMWFVRVDGRYAGTVIASTQEDAEFYAHMKFGDSWTTYEVSPRG
jgi:hypothetical protein